MSSRFEKNLFFTPFSKESRTGEKISISGQEVKHISKVLRYKEGDEITVANGEGVHATCRIESLYKDEVSLSIIRKVTVDEPKIEKVIGFGSIKTKDRLEFAIEKAVELGAWEICIFDADRSERSRINEDRLQSQILSAFKQSCRFYLPSLVVLSSLEEVFTQYSNYDKLIAYVGDDVETTKPDVLHASKNLLLVGPEGGFSEREIELAKSHSCQFVDLGTNRLRAETAVAAFLSQFLFSE